MRRWGPRPLPPSLLYLLLLFAVVPVRPLAPLANGSLPGAAGQRCLPLLHRTQDPGPWLRRYKAPYTDVSGTAPLPLYTLKGWRQHLKYAHRFPKKNIVFNWGLAALLKEFCTKFKVHSVLDFGGGTGWIAASLHPLVPVIAALEAQDLTPLGYYRATFAAGPVQYQVDAKAVALRSEFSVDLAMSYEVVHYLPRRLHCRAFNFLARAACHSLWFSMAQTFGRAGGAAEALRTPLDVQRDFEQRGLRLSARWTGLCRQNSTFGWMRHNCLVFRGPATRLPDCDLENRQPVAEYYRPTSRDCCTDVHGQRCGPCTDSGNPWERDH